MKNIKDDKIVLAIEEVKNMLDIWLPLKMEYDKVPATSIAITYNGKILFQQGFGYADIESKTKATENTVYHIASISKTFTSTAVLQLVEKNKLKLDDPVSMYVSWFKGKSKKGNLEDITIRQLLSHTSGVWRDGDTPHWVTGKFPKDLKSSAKDNLIFEPFSTFKYSNYGFALLGEVIKSVTGLTYGNYIEQNIFNVLGMNATSVDYNNAEKNLASGYGRMIPNTTREKFDHYITNAYAPATGFISSAKDLAKFVTSLTLKGPEAILSKKSKREMIQAHRDINDDDKYCLGIEMYKVNNKKIYSHGGSFQGFATQISFDQENDLGVVVLTNKLGGPAWSYTQAILQAIYSIVEDEANYISNKKINNKYQGIYRNIFGDQVIVKVKDNLVSFSVNTSSPLQKSNKIFLLPVTDDTFLLKGAGGFDLKGETVKFTDFKNGKPDTVIFGATPSKRIA